MKPTVRITKTKDHVAALTAALQALTKQDVMIGVPQEQTVRKEGDGVTNAELAYLHTNGSPLQNIPARPFLVPSFKANMAALMASQKRVFKAAVEGDKSEVNANMQKTGLIGQNAAKGWFTDPRNEWAPNTPYTIARKGSDRPLIDTGALRNSIVYVIRGK